MLEAIDAAERFIRRNTRQAEPIPRGRLQRELLAEFSPVMVRELLVNAIAHADYSRAGETIKVRRSALSAHGPSTQPSIKCVSPIFLRNKRTAAMRLAMRLPAR